MSSIDPDQNRVYDCEDRVARAVAAGAPIRAFGRDWQLEPEESFTTLSSAQLFTTLTCVANGLPPATVRHRAGERASHYQKRDATIALASWGATRSVLCHELAHHAAFVRGVDDDHGPVFRAAVCQLLASAGAPQQAAYLRAAFMDANLATARAL